MNLPVLSRTNLAQDLYSMKEVLDIFSPSIKKRPLTWCLILAIAYSLYYFIPPIAVATSNHVVSILYKKAHLKPQNHKF
jgi:hypothetical protein